MNVISPFLVSTSLQPVENLIIRSTRTPRELVQLVCEAGHRCRVFPVLTTSHDLRKHDGDARTDGATWP